MTSGVPIRIQPDGVVRSSTGAVAAAERITTVWRRLGFPRERLAAQVVPTPTCGLAGASPGYAHAALAACVEAGKRLVDQA